MLIPAKEVVRVGALFGFSSLQAVLEEVDEVFELEEVVVVSAFAVGSGETRGVGVGVGVGVWVGVGVGSLARVMLLSSVTCSGEPREIRR